MARILVVDDEQSMQEFMEILLVREGHEVVCCGSAQQALLALENDAFDLAISPDLAYHFIVAGRVQVSGGDTAGPQATIEVQSLDILISPRSG